MNLVIAQSTIILSGYNPMKIFTKQRTIINIGGQNSSFRRIKLEIGVRQGYTTQGLGDTLLLLN